MSKTNPKGRKRLLGDNEMALIMELKANGCSTRNIATVWSIDTRKMSHLIWYAKKTGMSGHA